MGAEGLRTFSVHRLCSLKREDNFSHFFKFESDITVRALAMISAKRKAKTAGGGKPENVTQCCWKL